MNNRNTTARRALLLTLITLLTLAGLFAMTTISASAVNVDYIDADGAMKTASNPMRITGETTTLDNAWYVVDSNVTIDERISVSGAVNLILVDGCTLTANEGIGVTDGNLLTIYGQTSGTGTLTATITKAEQKKACIGGESGDSGIITINGGKITATSTDSNNAYSAVIGGGDGGAGYVTINGGTVTATANYGWGAAIGGGRNGAGNVTINGGTVTAIGFQGAGIGGGNGGAGNVTIKDGNITATGGQYGAGIGGGNSGGGTIEINGGSITATGGQRGAGIGGGSSGGGTIEINGGTIIATGSDGGAGIGGGSVGGGTIEIKSGNITANGGDNGAGIGGGNERHGTIIIEGGTINATGGVNGAGIGGGYQGVGDVTIKGGNITATGGDNGAGIGGGCLRNDGSITVTIEGGTVKAEGGADAADLGYGVGVSLTLDITMTVKINGGSVMAANILGTPTNSDGDQLKLVPLSSDDVSAAGLRSGYTNGTSYDYGTKDMQPIGGTLYLYLPAEVTAGNYQVTLTAGAGTGEALTYYMGNTSYTLPDCPFTAPVGDVFKGWRVMIGADIADMDEGDVVNITADTTIQALYGIPVEYIDKDDQKLTRIDPTFITNTTTTLSTGWYVVNSNVTISSRITVSGDVHFILADCGTLTASNGIGVSSGNSLTIYRQEKGTGTLIANAGIYNAAIGGTDGNSDSGIITINGGTIEANGRK